MRATIFHGPGDVQVGSVPAPRLQSDSDAIVRVTHSCVCGSDLWAYRGTAKRNPGQPLGHEFLGIVEQVGAAVSSLLPGDRVLSPFSWSDGTCGYCRAGLQTSCQNGGFWGRTPGAGGAQADAVRVPWADGTLVKLPVDTPDAMNPALLTLCDVLGTGHHAAVCAGVAPGATVAVVGDGAVGLCAVLAARRLGAGHVIMLSRHGSRGEVGEKFGATVIEASPGAPVAELVRDLTDGLGADAVLECVGTEQALETAVSLARDGGSVGFVGVPHGVKRMPVSAMFRRNIGVRGGIAPVRQYIPSLLPGVLDGSLDASLVFDVSLPLDEAHRAYELMDTRRAIKVLLTA
ncbi:zinc-binding dehydrogenase [Micromonospora sediminicola]|uniref:zinc-binding dehydrogenase n=1 Tax=Micromonospora sediminicola TaxID=946078 RepID=UPI0037ABEEA5